MRAGQGGDCNANGATALCMFLLASQAHCNAAGCTTLMHSRLKHCPLLAGARRLLPLAAALTRLHSCARW